MQNPALVASLLVLGQSKELSRSDIKILSISTGHYERTKTKAAVGQAACKWGLVQWAPLLIETVMSAGDRYTQACAPSTFPLCLCWVILAPVASPLFWAPILHHAH